jgi:hypothetical protein
VPAGCAPQDVGICGHAYVLVPCDERHSDDSRCEDRGSARRVSPTSVIPELRTLAPHSPMPNNRVTPVRDRYSFGYQGFGGGV